MNMWKIAFRIECLACYLNISSFCFSMHNLFSRMQFNFKYKENNLYLFSATEIQDKPLFSNNANKIFKPFKIHLTIVEYIL